MPYIHVLQNILNGLWAQSFKINIVNQQDIISSNAFYTIRLPFLLKKKGGEKLLSIFFQQK